MFFSEAMGDLQHIMLSEPLKDNLYLRAERESERERLYKSK